MRQHVDCLDTSSENHGMITILLNLLSLSIFLRGMVAIKFIQIFSITTYHFQFLLKPTHFCIEILV